MIRGTTRFSLLNFAQYSKVWFSTKKIKTVTQIAKKQIDGARESIMSQEEFAKRKCLSYDDYVKQYGDLVKKKGLNPQKAYQRMIEDRYENYVYHKKIINPGRIF
ncbi:MAG: hypothetical protein KR126chlam5_01341 [Candidatus Anoxychlamydiales bacterium]|nr:hypothetical protein [Candidatus Anoxychlamydiales bacterium]